MVTEFTDHICVTMDAELIMFLHDLVSAYLKEKEKGFCPVALQKTAPRLRFHAAGHMPESSVKCGKLSIIFTRGGEVTEPDANGISMGPPFVGKRQISTLYAGNLASSPTIRAAPH